MTPFKMLFAIGVASVLAVSAGDLFHLHQLQKYAEYLVSVEACFFAIALYDLCSKTKN